MARTTEVVFTSIGSEYSTLAVMEGEDPSRGYLIFPSGIEVESIRVNEES